MAVYKRGNRWVADFYLGGRGGRRIRVGVPSKQLAEAYERDAKLREFKGEVLDTRRSDIRLSGFIQKYRELHESGNRETTQERDTYILNKLLDHLGDPLLHYISREDLETYKARRKRSVSPATVNLELRVIKSLFNRAKDWGYLKASPADGVQKYKLDEKEPCFLTAAEGAVLMDVAEGQMKGFIVTGLNTGLRKGELFHIPINLRNLK